MVAFGALLRGAVEVQDALDGRCDGQCCPLRPRWIRYLRIPTCLSRRVWYEDDMIVDEAASQPSRYLVHQCSVLLVQSHLQGVATTCLHVINLPLSPSQPSQVVVLRNHAVPAVSLFGGSSLPAAVAFDLLQLPFSSVTHFLLNTTLPGSSDPSIPINTRLHPRVLIETVSANFGSDSVVLVPVSGRVLQTATVALMR